MYYITNRYAEETREKSDCAIVYVPTCTKQGNFTSRQCNHKTGVCWCVTPQGNYIDDTMVRGVPQCATVTQTQVNQADSNPIDVNDVNFEGMFTIHDFIVLCL